MYSTPWDPQGEAQAALRAIVSDPRYGIPALSNAQILSNTPVDGSANLLTAAICQVTGGQPGSVCASSTIVAEKAYL